MHAPMSLSKSTQPEVRVSRKEHCWKQGLLGPCRRVLWMEGGIQMFISLCCVSGVLAFFGSETWTAWATLGFVCVYISAYAW